MTGRGAFLKKLLDVKQREEPPVGNLRSGSQPEVSKTEVAEAASVPKSAGDRRKALLGLLSSEPVRPGLKDIEQYEKEQENVPVVSTGRGRAKLLKNLTGAVGRSDPPVSCEDAVVPKVSVNRDPPASCQDAVKPKPKLPFPASASSADTTTYQTELSLKSLTLSEPVIKRGTTGRSFTATANYVQIDIEQGRGIFEYEVRFTPDVEHKAYRCKILNHHIKPKRGVRCFDGGDKLYLPEKLSGGDTLVFQSEHQLEDGSVEMMLIYKRILPLRESSHFYNVLFNNIQKVLELARLGRHYYDCKLSCRLPQHKLELWPGFITAVDEYEGGVFLNCDTTHRVLRTETPYEVMRRVSQVSRDYHGDIVKELVGEVVITRYNNQLYRIDDISFETTPKSSFTLRDGSSMTFLEYYRKTYNLKIDDPDQPLLLNKVKKKQQGQEGDVYISLIPELCFLTGLTDQMRGDFRLMKEVAMHTKVSPQNKQLCFKKFLQNVLNNPNATQMLSDWGLRLSPDPIVLDARVLMSESLLFGNNTKMAGQPKAMWLKQAKSFQVLKAVDINCWAICYTQRDAPRCKNFISVIRKVSPAMGFEVREPTSVALRDDKTTTFTDSIRKLITDHNGRLQIIVVMCPTSRDDRYIAIKKTTCVDYPIPSQVVNSGTIAKEEKARSIIQNIALQMNCKLGGALWTISLPITNAMICGIDTYHDKDRRFSSVGGFVSSIDPQFTQWFSRCFIQTPGQELITGLSQCFSSSLSVYLHRNQVLPDVIIIFRDGVGDGQLDLCLKVEVQQFLKTCENKSPGYRPKLTVIVVQKRINTRFFCQTDSSGRLDNPEPGSVLDHTVTRRYLFDFFLVSQYVNQGTATPSHYVVLHDDSSFKPDHLQRLAYKFCHLYYNWPGTIRVPAPCQYAHRLAQLVGQHLKTMPSSKLDELLFYL